mgnify:CR=1 FL=1
MRDKLVRKVLEYRDRLEDLLRDERIVYSLLRDPDMRYKLLLVAGALKLRVPLLAPSVSPGASGVSRTAYPKAP